MGHGGHSLVARGLYALQLEPWLRAFPLAGPSSSGRLLVVKLEELTGKAAKAAKSGDEATRRAAAHQATPFTTHPWGSPSFRTLCFCWSSLLFCKN